MDLKDLINNTGNQNNSQNNWGGNGNNNQNGNPWGGNNNGNNNQNGNPWGGNNNGNNNQNGNPWGGNNNGNNNQNGNPWGDNDNNQNNNQDGWGGANQQQKMKPDQNVIKEISERLRSMNSYMESAYTTLVSRNKTRSEVGDMVSSATYKNKLTVDYDNANRSIVPMFSFRGDIGGNGGSTQGGFGGGFGGSNFMFNGNVSSGNSSNDATYGVGVAFKNIDDRFTDIVNTLSKYDINNLDLCEGYCSLSCFNGGALVLAPSTQLLNEKKSSL